MQKKGCRMPARSIKTCAGQGGQQQSFSAGGPRGLGGFKPLSMQRGLRDAPPKMPAPCRANAGYFIPSSELGKRANDLGLRHRGGGA